MESSLPNDRKHPSPCATGGFCPTVENIRSIRQFPPPHEDIFILAETVPYWFQLLRHSPVLAFMVARCWHFDEQPQKGAEVRIRQYVRLKRSTICEAMGFPSDPRTVRLISRMQICEDLVQNLLILRELLRWEPATRDILNRGGYITTHQLSRLALGDRWHEWLSVVNLVGLTWFFKLPAARRYWLADRYYSACSPSDLSKAFMKPVRGLWQFRNERQAVSYFADYQRHRSAIWKAEEQLKLNAFGWPEPPIQAAENITPVLSIEALEREGQQMRHCVASYASRVFLGDYYVYRVECSIPCTLGIHYKDSSWKIDQLKGEHNEKPPEDIFKMVNDWLITAPKPNRDLSIRRQYLQTISKLCGLPLLERSK